MGLFRNIWSALTGSSSTEEEEQYLPLEGENQLNALRWYYENNATYDRLATALQGIPNSPVLKGIRSLGNPAHRVAEFYAAKMIPQELLETLEAKENIKLCIEKVDKWSNWPQRQRVASRWSAIYGNLFIKIASSEDNSRVYRQLLDPRHITYFETDERDFFTYLRIDIPQEKRDTKGELENFWETEIYDKDKSTYKVWEHEEGPQAELEGITSNGKLIVNERLERRPVRGEDGAPLVEQGRRVVHTGYDFIPVVHIKFRDIGNDWGLGAFSHVLEAIDALNLALTRLDKMLFPKTHLALKANAATPEGQPLDAPALESALADHTEGDVDTVDVSGTVLWRLPGTSSIESVVPAIDFASHLAAIDQKLNHLEKDLPELAYYRLRDMQEISGRAARILLGDLIDRVQEARDNFLAGLVRSNEMALTIGKVIGLEDFQGLGEFEDEALEHSYDQPDIFPISDLEEAEGKKAQAEADEIRMRVYGLTPEFVRKEAGLEDAEVSPDQPVVSPTDSSPVNPAIQRAVENLGIRVDTGGETNGRLP